MGFEVLAALIAGLVLASMLKPWAWGAPATSARPVAPPRPVITAAPPRPTDDATPAGLAASVCLGTDAWRIASLETWPLVSSGEVRTQQVRVWRAIAPVATAAGPLDPAIPVVAVAGTEVGALGWCAPATGAASPRGPVQVLAWRVSADGLTATAITLRRVAPSAGDTPLAALYREVTDCVAGYGCSGSGVPLLAATWAAGRCVFRYATGDGRTQWFGAEVQILPEPTPPAADPGSHG